MDIILFNTLGREKQVFKSIEPGKVAHVYMRPYGL